MEKELEPLAMFLYSIKSGETKSKYRNKLDAFFDFVGLKGTLEEKAEQFVEKARGDRDWAFSQVMKFVSYQRQRAERNEIVNGTVLNYYKPVKLFCEVNDIELKWKRISRGLPRGQEALARQDSDHRGDSKADRVSRQEDKAGCDRHVLVRDKGRGLGLFEMEKRRTRLRR